MGFNNWLKTRGACPPGYEIKYLANDSAGRTEYRIFFKGKDTGWAGLDEKVAIRAMKDMARNNKFK
jgi:hypothetical protein